MLLNRSKCKLLTYGRKNKIFSHTYTLNTTPLKTASSFKCFGVHSKANLTQTQHIYTITAEASRTLGYLKGNLKSASPHLRRLSYETYVRTKLEYASAIWDPHQSYLINNIEAVQYRIARFI